MQQTIVIIGSGLAGYLVLRALREQGCQRPITVLTQLGGDFYSKPLLSAAIKQGKMPDDLISMSREQMAARYQADIVPHCCIKTLDPQNKVVIDAANQSWAYQDLILACGAHPIDLDLPGDAPGQVNHLEDYRTLRASLEEHQRIVLLGGGLVGTEFACDLAAGGHHVEVVHDQAYPVNQLLPEPIGQALKSAMTEQLGVVWHTQETACAVDAAGVKLASGGTVLADKVISAVGLRPNTLLAKQAGLAVSYGIKVDRYCQTSQAGIYALGDCAEVAGHVAFYVPRLRECAEVIAACLQGTPRQVIYQAMPVLLKTPPCRIAVCPPPRGIEGQWEVSGSGADLEAVFYTKDRKPVGCAFSGKGLAARPKWIEQMPSVFSCEERR